MKLSPQVLNALDAARCQDNQLVLSGQLDRKLYMQVNTALEALGGKWNRKAKAHVFPSDAALAVENILLAGEVTLPKDFGFFETPPELAQQVIQRAGIKPGDWVLEPSAGRGALAIPAYAITPDVFCVELLPENVQALKAVLPPDNVTAGDFLAQVPLPLFNRVVMNPPFSYAGLPQADIHHVTHALRFLKPGGRLVAIMAASVLFRNNRLTREFRDRALGKGGTITPLPEGSFKASGTGVNTALVTLDA